MTLRLSKSIEHVPLPFKTLRNVIKLQKVTGSFSNRGDIQIELILSYLQVSKSHLLKLLSFTIKIIVRLYSVALAGLSMTL